MSYTTSIPTYHADTEPQHLSQMGSGSSSSVKHVMRKEEGVTGHSLEISLVELISASLSDLVFTSNSSNNTTHASQTKHAKHNRTKEHLTHLCAMFATNSARVQKDTWLADTGANSHIANDLKWFKNFLPFRQRIGTACNEEALKIEGGGTTYFLQETSTDESVELSLSDVAYTPKARCNLVSIHALVSKINGHFVFDSDGATLYDSIGQEVAYADAENSLYALRIQELPTVEPPRKEARMVAHLDFQNDPVWIWHRRLGHLGLESMKKLRK